MDPAWRGASKQVEEMYIIISKPTRQLIRRQRRLREPSNVLAIHPIPSPSSSPHLPHPPSRPEHTTHPENPTNYILHSLSIAALFNIRFARIGRQLELDLSLGLLGQEAKQTEHRYTPQKTLGPFGEIRQSTRVLQLQSFNSLCQALASRRYVGNCLRTHPSCAYSSHGCRQRTQYTVEMTLDSPYSRGPNHTHPSRSHIPHGVRSHRTLSLGDGGEGDADWAPKLGLRKAWAFQSGAGRPVESL